MRFQHQWWHGKRHCHPACLVWGSPAGILQTLWLIQSHTDFSLYQGWRTFFFLHAWARVTTHAGYKPGSSHPSRRGSWGWGEFNTSNDKVTFPPAISFPNSRAMSAIGSSGQIGIFENPRNHFCVHIPFLLPVVWSYTHMQFGQDIWQRWKQYYWLGAHRIA